MQVVEKFKVAAMPRQPLGPGYTGLELLDANLPEPEWVVKDLLPEGFGFLGGPKKSGKSLIALNLCIAIASGQKFLDRYEVEKGAALYLDLEQPDLWAKKRLNICLAGKRPPGLENLHLRPKGSWPRMNNGGL